MPTTDVSPYDPQSVGTGAVVTYRGDHLVTSGASIVEAIDAGSTDGAWLLPEVVTLHRGQATIVPLSWEPVDAGGDAQQVDTLRRRATELWTEVSGACQYRHGAPISIGLDAGTTDPYAIALRRSGARRADRWTFGDAAVVLVVYGEGIPAPKSATAVQVVPLAWVTDTRKRPAVDVDLAWTWADVVEAADQTRSNPEN